MNSNQKQSLINKKPLIISIAILALLMTGLLVAFTLRAKDNTIKNNSISNISLSSNLSLLSSSSQNSSSFASFATTKFSSSSVQSSSQNSSLITSSSSSVSSQSNQNLASSSLSNNSNLLSSSSSKAQIQNNQAVSSTAQIPKTSGIKIKNTNQLTSIPKEDLGCMGVINKGEYGYYPKVKEFRNSTALINTQQNLPTMIVVEDNKEMPKPNDRNTVTKLLNYLNSGNLPELNETGFEKGVFGDRENVGYQNFGCSNYASVVYKQISINMQGVDKARAYMSFGTQGGIPLPAIEIYAKKGNDIMQITHIPIVKPEDTIGASCGAVYGLTNDAQKKCYIDNINKTLPDSVLTKKVQELVAIYAVE
jgi:hypothetical protein